MSSLSMRIYRHVYVFNASDDRSEPNAYTYINKDKYHTSPSHMSLEVYVNYN